MGGCHLSKQIPINIIWRWMGIIGSDLLSQLEQNCLIRPRLKSHLKENKSVIHTPWHGWKDPTQTRQVKLFKETFAFLGSERSAWEDLYQFMSENVTGMMGTIFISTNSSNLVRNQASRP